MSDLSTQSASLRQQQEAEQTERIYHSQAIVTQREKTLEALKPQTGETLLDIGCGPGFLLQAIAQNVGPEGRVHGIDINPAMRSLAQARCADFSQVNVAAGDALSLPLADQSLDAVSCTQVLLYVSDVPAALAEMRRVIKPGGRLVIVETDWRSAVFSTADKALGERAIVAWDNAVASPNLPPVLPRLLREAGFQTPEVQAIPLLDTQGQEGSYAREMSQHLLDYGLKDGSIQAEEVDAWRQEQAELKAQGNFFFCVNRFLFVARA